MTTRPTNQQISASQEASRIAKGVTNFQIKKGKDKAGSIRIKAPVASPGTFSPFFSSYLKNSRKQK